MVRIFNKFSRLVQIAKCKLAHVPVGLSPRSKSPDNYNENVKCIIRTLPTVGVTLDAHTDNGWVIKASYFINTPSWEFYLARGFESLIKYLYYKLKAIRFQNVKLIIECPVGRVITNFE